MLRSLFAVVAGFVARSLLWCVSNFVAMPAAPSHYQEDGSTHNVAIPVLFLVLPVCFSLLSGYLTARMAPAKAVSHATALGVVLLAVGILVQLQYWEVMPLWYHLSFLAFLLPSALLGGRLADPSRLRT